MRNNALHTALRGHLPPAAIEAIVQVNDEARAASRMVLELAKLIDKLVDSHLRSTDKIKQLSALSERAREAGMDAKHIITTQEARDDDEPT